jgi:serine/threonine-protein kinase ATR
MLLLATGLLVSVPRAYAWDADAGVIPSFTDLATVTTTGGASSAAAVNDGDDQTSWQSDSCFPTGFLTRTDLNPIADACASGNCTVTGTGATDGATDASMYTSASVAWVSGVARLRIALDTPKALDAIAFRGFGGAVTVYAETSAGLVAVGSYATTDAYTFIRYPAPADVVTAVVVESTTAFTATEVGAYAGPCTQSAVLDLGVSTTLGVVRTRHWAGGRALSTTLYGSEDGVTWTALASLDPDALGSVDTVLDRVDARYLSVTHEVSTGDYEKVYVWEIDAWGPDGPHGALPSPQPSGTTMRELLGVNGIWGWGTSAYSDSATSGSGPALYAEVASHARNYHNLRWDVTDPDHVPDYAHMATSGTEAQSWLDWDREYSAWTDAGMQVDASIQFLDATSPMATWDDPYRAAYTYAEAMAAHFGPTTGTGTLTSIEAGNEAWDYPATFYAEVLRGFVDGAAAGDPAVLVLPGALQASDPGSESTSGGDYLGARVSSEVGPRLGAINVHSYSYMNGTDGERIATYPEDPGSSYRSLLDAMRWRDANLPGTPLWLTEWGWDSDGAGESCNDGECVTEAAQAIYAVRGACLWSRLGFERATWFFYANLEGCDTLYCRSGLTGSAATGFAPKRAYVALQALLAQIGDRYFLGALREDDDAWVYRYGDADGHASHLVAWRPVAASDGTTTSVVVDALRAEAAWTVSGVDPAGEPEVLPLHDADGLHLTISAVPMIVALATGPEDTGGDSGADRGGDSAGDTQAESGGPGGKDAETKVGCGCASGGAGAAGLWGFGVLLLVGLRRVGGFKVKRGRGVIASSMP